ncbi:MAG TPA: YceI family protein [Gemmatimonadaceae bacterium]|jgi:polyisoprenoid-binding protein YceI
MTVKSVVVALGLLASAGLAAGAQSKSSKAAAKPAPAPANLHLTVAPVGNEARYRVREVLAGHEMENEAVGVTDSIRGNLVVQPNGTIVSDSSLFVVNIAVLKSDQKRRDAYIKENTLHTDKYPTVQIVPKSFVGLTARPSQTPVAFQMIGDLTIEGVTHPTTWDVSAHAQGNDIVGTAKTQFLFSDFAMEKPHRAVVFSVTDTVKLEYDFHLTQVPPQ